MVKNKLLFILTAAALLSLGSCGRTVANSSVADSSASTNSAVASSSAAVSSSSSAAASSSSSSSIKHRFKQFLAVNGHGRTGIHS